MKKSIAIIIKGGIGVGFGLEGCVWLSELCENIAKHYDLTVFSLVKVNKNYQPKGYQLISPPFDDNKKSTIVLFCYILSKIISLHFQKKISIIHGFWAYPSGALALLAGKMLGLKTIITFIGSEISNIPSINYGLYRSKFKKKLIQFTAKSVDLVIAQTYSHARKMKTNISYKKMEIISFGIDLTKFPVINKPICSPYQFLYLGDINRVKDLPTLIQAFQNISQHIEARLDIVGLDTLNGEIQRLVSELNLSDKITFHNRQLNNQLTFFLRKAHILLHTSLSEAHALVVNEAMASGVVVCGTRVGIIDDLEDKITTVVAVGDAEGLAIKVLNLLDNPLKYEALRARGIEWSKENDLRAQCQKYIQVYEDILA